MKLIFERRLSFMKKHIFTAAIIVFSTGTISAQDWRLYDQNNDSTGTIGYSDEASLSSIYLDSTTQSYLDRYTKENINKVKGYRIEIFSQAGANSKSKAKEMEKKFKTQFPELAAYILWDNPNYELRVGDYRTRLEAEKALSAIKAYFPFAFIREDKINYSIG